VNECEWEIAVLLADFRSNDRYGCRRTNRTKNSGKHGRFCRGRCEVRHLVKKYPKDSQARIFLWLALGLGSKEGPALLESVLKDDPSNSAANHYYIHGVEASPHPEQALHSAEILPSLALASGHMVHMPGHIYYRLGDYARAEQAFDASISWLGEGEVRCVYRDMRLVAKSVPACLQFCGNSRWCREGDLNPHDLLESADFKSAASADFAIPACHLSSYPK
jgi:hypothetical protein